MVIGGSTAFFVFRFLSPHVSPAPPGLCLLCCLSSLSCLSLSTRGVSYKNTCGIFPHWVTYIYSKVPGGTLLCSGEIGVLLLLRYSLLLPQQSFENAAITHNKKKQQAMVLRGRGDHHHHHHHTTLTKSRGCPRAAAIKNKKRTSARGYRNFNMMPFYFRRNLFAIFGPFM